MVRVNFKKYFLYMLRWQLSTPPLAIILILLASLNKWVAIGIANLIGGLIFFWVDLYIFTSKKLSSEWEVKENIKCVDCSKISRGYRIIKTPNYDMTHDTKPKFRCEVCSKKKADKLKSEGIVIN